MDELIPISKTVTVTEIQRNPKILSESGGRDEVVVMKGGKPVSRIRYTQNSKTKNRKSANSLKTDPELRKRIKELQKRYKNKGKQPTKISSDTVSPFQDIKSIEDAVEWQRKIRDE